MSKVFKKVFKVAAPVLGSVVGNAILPGIGGSILGGALGGLGSGGGVKGAVLGGLGGALTSGITNYFKPAAGAANAASSGASTWINPNTGMAATNWVNPNSVAQGVGSAVGGATSNWINPNTGAAASNWINPNTVGSDIFSKLGSALTSQSTGDWVKAGISGLSVASQTEALNRIAKQQAMANQNALSSVSPFVGAGQAAQSRLGTLLGLGGQNPDEVLESLRSSPGYQFRLQQGQEALDRQLATRGSLFSGRALQESQRMGQGLADQTYTDYVNNLNRQAALGLGGAGMQAGLYQSAGDIQANRIGAQNDVLNQTLADILAPRY